jgi:hypothetical protein
MQILIIMSPLSRICLILLTILIVALQTGGVLKKMSADAKREFAELLEAIKFWTLFTFCGLLVVGVVALLLANKVSSPATNSLTAATNTPIARLIRLNDIFDQLAPSWNSTYAKMYATRRIYSMQSYIVLIEYHTCAAAPFNNLYFQN